VNDMGWQQRVDDQERDHDFDALVDRIAKTQAHTHGVPDAWTSFIPEAEAIAAALFGEQIKGREA
jgi:hypothetical protein